MQERIIEQKINELLEIKFEEYFSNLKISFEEKLIGVHNV